MQLEDSKFYQYFSKLSRSTGLNFKFTFFNTKEKALEKCSALDKEYYNSSISDDTYIQALEELEEQTLEDIDSNQMAEEKNDQLDLFYQLEFGILNKLISEALEDKLLPKEIEVNFQKRTRITTYEENDTKIKLTTKDPNKINAYLNEYHKVAFKAPTGSGKSRLLVKMVATSGPSDYGIILTNSNDDAFELKEDILALNPNMKDYVRVFNSDGDDYADLKSDPARLNKCRWIICWSGRMFDGDITVLFDIMFSNRPYSAIKNARKYVYSDECVKVNKMRFINHGQLLKLCELTGIELFKLADDFSDDNLKIVLDNIQEFDDEVYECIHNKSNITQKVKNSLSKLIGTYKLPTLYQLRIEIQRFKYLLKALKRSPKIMHDLLYNEGFTYGYRINITDIDDDYYIAIFDATAHIMYKDSKYFKLIDIGVDKKDIVQLHGLDWVVPNRYDQTSAYDEFFKKVKEGTYKFKDNSLIIWFKHGNNKSHMIKERLSKLLYAQGLRKFRVDHFNGTKLFSCNDFTELTNVYILGYFRIADSGLKEYTTATGNKISFDGVFLNISEQGIGRTNYRNQLGPEGVLNSINVYLVNTIPSDCIKELVEYYRSSWVGTDLMECPGMLERAYMETDKFHQRGKGLKSNAIKVIEYISNDPFREYSLKELIAIGEYSKCRKESLKSVIQFYKELNINLIVK